MDRPHQSWLAGPIKDPVGWLVGLALPQRQRCDERMPLDCAARWPPSLTPRCRTPPWPSVVG
ncbi:hypothetical protein ACFVW2_33450 [Streptomyces sp. NPDC058171]